MPPTTRTAQPELSPCLRGTSNEVAEGVLLHTLSIACCSGVVKAYSAFSVDGICHPRLVRHNQNCPCLRGDEQRSCGGGTATHGLSLRTLSIACCNGVVKAYSAFSTPLLFQLEEIDKSCFSQPARHHLRRCDSRPIAASLVDYWLLH